MNESGLVLPHLATFNHAHIHQEPAHPQLIEDNILHNVRDFLLSKIEASIAKAYINTVVFLDRLEIFAPFDIIPRCTFKEVGIHQMGNVTVGGLIRQFDMLHRLHGVGQSRRIGQRTDGRAEHIGQRFQPFAVLEVVTVHHIRQIHLLPKPTQIRHLLLATLHVAQGGHTTKRIVFLPQFAQRFRSAGNKLLEGERPYAHLVTATAEEGVDVAAEIMAIAPRHIYVDIVLGSQPIDNTLKAFDLLHLVKHHVILDLRIRDTRIQIVFQGGALQKLYLIVLVVQIEG